MVFTLSKEEVLSSIKKQFIIPLDYDLKRQLKIINKNKYVDYSSDSINLFLQSYETIQNSLKLINKGSVVDSAILCRTAFENILTALVISNDEETYKEFKKLILNDESRNKTKPQTIINNSIKIIKTMELEIFSEINKADIKRTINETYKKLCLFVHSSLMVSVVKNMKNNNDQNVLIPLYKINIYFIKVFLLYILESITKSKFVKFELENVFFAFISIGLVLDKEKTENIIKKYSAPFEKNVNEIKNSKDYKKIQNCLDELKELEKDLNIEEKEKIAKKILNFYDIDFNELTKISNGNNYPNQSS